MLEIGRVCIKTAGREAGKACVVIDTIDDTYVMITGPKGLTRVKRRKCNIAHLEPLEALLKLAKNAPDPEVEKLLKAEKVLEGLRSGKPAARAAKKPEEKPEPRKEEKRGLRARFLGRAKKEEKPKMKKEGKKPEEPKTEKKEKKSKAVKKPGKPKSGKAKPLPAKKASK